jgi:mono/diheme cytochrome c family protein
MRLPAFLIAAALITTFSAGCFALAADQATLDRGKKIEQTGCIACHSARLIESQRLSRAAWDRELTKMTGWGWEAPADDRAALLEYLVANFGDDKPAIPAERSGDGRGQKE